MPELRRDGATIYYECAGSGAPALVLIHGLTCALDDWSGQVAHFARAHTVVSLDLRGHGRSAGFSGGFDMPTMSADVAALLEALDLGPAVLAGHSMGCRMVLQTARIAPERVAGAVLVDGSRFAAGDPEAAKARTREMIDATGYAALVNRLFDEMFTPSSDLARKTQIVERARRMPEPTGRDLLANMCAWDAAHLESALERLQVPVLAIQSTHVNEERVRVTLQRDETTPYIDVIAEHVPNARIEIVPGIGHFTMIDATERTNELIGEFMASLDP